MICFNVCASIPTNAKYAQVTIMNDNTPGTNLFGFECGGSSYNNADVFVDLNNDCSTGIYSVRGNANNNRQTSLMWNNHHLPVVNTGSICGGVESVYICVVGNQLNVNHVATSGLYCFSCLNQPIAIFKFY